MAQTADRRLQITGQDVQVTTFGEPADPPILLMPSMLDPASSHSDSVTWPDALCVRLAEGSRFVVRYDYGSPASTPTLAVLARIATAALDAVELSAAHFVVRPGDILVGGLLINEQPDRVASVTAVSPDAADDEAVDEILAATTSNPAGSRPAPRAVEEDTPAAFFEALYQATAGGTMQLPWDRPAPHPLLVDWATTRGVTGEGQRAVVVGCGLGVDAEYVAGLGFDTVAFDVSETAVNLAKQQNPDSPVWYMTADLINLPRQWRRTFDLVVEIYTVQALPDPPRADAIANIAQLVGSGGTLLAIAFVGEEYRTGGFPPWPLTSVEINAFAANGLSPVAIEQLPHAGSADPRDRLWRAELRRFDPVVPK